MVANDAPQGSAAWHDARLGKVTASRFADVLTKPRSGDGLSKTARSYMLELMAEKLTLEPQGFKGNAATDWGNEHEADAVAVYEAITQTKVKRVGFIDGPTRTLDVGGSPDGLIGDDGGAEFKCPFNSRIHLEYWLGNVCPKEHVAQVQGYMWVTERLWWDFCSYDPRCQDYGLRLFCVRVERDEKYIDNLAYRVASFMEVMFLDLEKLNERLSK